MSPSVCAKARPKTDNSLPPLVQSSDDELFHPANTANGKKKKNQHGHEQEEEEEEEVKFWRVKKFRPNIDVDEVIIISD